MNKLKISIIEPIFDNGGLLIYDYGVCFGLASNNVNVNFYTSEESNKIPEIKNLVVQRVFKNVYNKNYNKIIRGIYFLRGLFKITKDLYSKKPDIIYTHLFTYSFQELVLVFFLKLQNRKIILNIHDPISLGNRSNTFISKLFIKIIDRSNFYIFTHTQISRTILRKQLPNKKIGLMPHSDLDILFNKNFEKDKLYKTLNLEPNTKFVLFFGQIKASKGVDLLLKAWSKISAIHKNYKLLIVGRKWQNDSIDYHNLINDENISDSVIWIEEYIPNEKVPLYFKISDLVVLPYLRLYSSGVLLRALGYRMPIVCSDIEAFSEVVNERVCRFFKSNDVKSLSNAINDMILLNGHDNKKLIDNIDQYIDKNLKWELIGSKMKSIFEEVIEQ